MATFSFFKCPNCKLVQPAGAWNAATLAYTTDKKVKFTTKIQNAGNAAHLLYVCPNCKAINRKPAIHGMLKTAVTNQAENTTAGAIRQSLEAPWN